MTKTQEDRFLDWLRERGDRGVHTFEMRKAYIGNPSERKSRLEKRGHVLAVSEKERLNGEAWGVRYFLIFDVERDTASPAPPSAGDVRHGAVGEPRIVPEKTHETADPPAPPLGVHPAARAQTPTYRGAGVDDRVGQRDARPVSAGAVSTKAEPKSGPALGADLTQQAPEADLVAQQPRLGAAGRRDDPIQTPVSDAAPRPSHGRPGPTSTPCAPDLSSVQQAPALTLTGQANTSGARPHHAIDDDYDWNEAA